LSVYSSLAVQHERKGTKENKTRKGAPGSYQRLDLFKKVLRVLCPNLTDDPFITTAAPERNAVRIHNQEIYHQSFIFGEPTGVSENL